MTRALVRPRAMALRLCAVAVGALAVVTALSVWLGAWWLDVDVAAAARLASAVLVATATAAMAVAVTTVSRAGSLYRTLVRASGDPDAGHHALAHLPFTLGNIAS